MNPLLFVLDLLLSFHGRSDFGSGCASYSLPLALSPSLQIYWSRVARASRWKAPMVIYSVPVADFTLGGRRCRRVSAIA
jgi:hypothetical protein